MHLVCTLLLLLVLRLKEESAKILVELASMGIIERGVPQAYVCARASSATVCSVHGLRVFPCIFDIRKGI